MNEILKFHVTIFCVVYIFVNIMVIVNIVVNFVIFHIKFALIYCWLESLQGLHWYFRHSEDVLDISPRKLYKLGLKMWQMDGRSGKVTPPNFLQNGSSVCD